MAIKFNDSEYWNPAEWVSRTLFSKIVETKIVTNTEYEKALKDEIRNCIKTYVWLIDFTYSEPYKLEIFQEITNNVNKEIEVPKEYKEGYIQKSLELQAKLSQHILDRLNHEEWNYLEGWKKGFGISISELEEWAYSENGIFTDQDEDLMMRNPDLILPMFNLLGSKWSRRNKDLNLTLLSYYQEHIVRGRDKRAASRFNEILKIEKLNSKQQELVNRLKSS